MPSIKQFRLFGALTLMTACLSSPAAPLTATVQPVSGHPADIFNLGTARHPDGTTITTDRASLRLNDQPWTPVMGEFHYTRYPANEWRDELLKMKAGGISIVATYVFWIHHEEIEGEWNWSDRHNLREFVQLAGSVGLKVIVRCGPWCHGEVRNGGLPEWLLHKDGWKLRSEDERFLGKVNGLYGQIAQQLDRLLWKDGGPVIGIQVDNEYRGPAEYLLTLKKIARDAGLDVPIYTRTGWPALTTPMPFGEIVPLYGSYAEGFWDRELTSMPGRYWAAFRFSTLRTDDNIANEQLGRRDTRDAPDVARYPFLTCEVGGGMVSSYHRRILIHPADIETTALVKLGCGSTLLGYYMYHGGTNPEGKLTTLMEAQDTLNTNYNDMPVKNYDFQAPLGQFGQIRPSYHLLRRLHLFLDDFGPQLARMPATLPDVIAEGAKDYSTPRWSVRSNGRSGFVFMSNYERGASLLAKPGVQFAVTQPDGVVTFPAAPVTVPAGSRFFWPFNFELGHGVMLDWATAQPICAIDEGEVRTVFFAETAGIAAQFAIAGEKDPRALKPGRGIAAEFKGTASGSVRLVLLSDADSLALWKGEWQGRPRVFLTRAGLVIDGDVLRLNSPDSALLSVGIFPAPPSLPGGHADGLFTHYAPKRPTPVQQLPAFDLVQSAGPAREVKLGKASDPVAAQPGDADFKSAAVWRVTLPPQLDLSTNPILRVRYLGDVARLTLNGKLLTDDFYNGGEWDIGLREYAPAILKGELAIAILPLRKDSVTGPARKIYLADAQVPDFSADASVGALQSITIVPRYEVRLGGKP